MPEPCVRCLFPLGGWGGRSLDQSLLFGQFEVMRRCHTAGARLLLSAGPVRPLRLPLLFHHAQDPRHNGHDYRHDPEDDGGGHHGRDVGSLQAGTRDMSEKVLVLS